MNLQEFFFRHHVFTYDEFRAHCLEQEARERRTVDSLLTYHLKQGRLLRVRRGLFASVSPGVLPKDAPVDSYLMASRLAPDAVLAYHSALEVYGKVYSTFHKYFYLTDRAARFFEFRGEAFVAVRFPSGLKRYMKETEEVESHDRLGLPIRVTSLERTVVDVFDRLDLGGGWEEVWRSAEMVEFFKLDRMIDYALLLDNATTCAKLGFFLEQNRSRLFVTDIHLDRLQVHAPKKPHYLNRGSRDNQRLVSRWNIIVPEGLLGRSWEEPA